MKGSLLFVHGTGVRAAGWVTTWNRVKDYSAMAGLEGIDHVGCDWGLRFGVKDDLIADTLPLDAATKGLLAAPPAGSEIDAASWALLRDDPAFELRLAAASGSAASAGGGTAAGWPGGVTVGALRPDQAAVGMLERLASQAPQPDPAGGGPHAAAQGQPAAATATAAATAAAASPEPAALDLAGSGLDAAEIRDAARAVAASPELAAAAQAAGDAADPGFVAAVARAVVAKALAAHRGDEAGNAPLALLDRGSRDRLVEAIATALAPALTKGLLLDTLKARITAFGLQKATRLAADRRQGLMGGSMPAIGDILYYQRRGEAIRDYIAAKLAGLRPPVVAVGHSLGGIALVDLLASPRPPHVDLLVTAGSQAPLLYAIDALGPLRRGQAAPEPFTPWLNIYNRQDFLSFCASRVFPSRKNLWDEEVDPCVPFPESHSAYWTCLRVYELILEHWPQ